MSSLGIAEPPPPAPKARRGRVAKTPQAQHIEEPLTAPARMSRRVKTETHSLDIDVFTLTVPSKKTTTQRRGTRSKSTVTPSAIGEPEDHSELEEATPSVPKARASRKAAVKTPVIHEAEEDKENSEDQSVKTSGKATGTRARKTPAASTVEVGDAPARRTRSRK